MSQPIDIVVDMDEWNRTVAEIDNAWNTWAGSIWDSMKDDVEKTMTND